MQRVVGAPPVVVETAGFEADLQTWQSPTFLAPLSHQISIEAPAGTADLARPVPVPHAGEFPLRQAPAKRPAPAVQRAVSAVAAESNPSLVSAPQVARQPLQLPALPSMSASPADSTEDVADSVVVEPAGAEAPTLGAPPDLSVSTADVSATEPAPPAAHGWRPQPGGVGLPLREMPGAARRSRPAESPAAGAPVQRAGLPTSAAHPPATGAPSQPASPEQAARWELPLPKRGAEQSAPAGAPDERHVADVPLIGDRPVQRQADETAGEEPAPVQLSRPGQHDAWVGSAQLPGIGVSPYAPAFAPASRPLLGARPLLASGASPDLPGTPLAASVPSASQQTPARGPAVQRGIGPGRLPAAYPTPRSAAGAPAVQLMRMLPGQPYQAAVMPGAAAPATSPTRATTLPPVQRSHTATAPPRFADPGAAAINAGVASRDTDGSVVFRSFLDDAASSVKEKASSAAHSAISDARSHATEAASGALTKASNAAHGAVSDATAHVASAAGLPAPGAAGATGDLDDLARKLYDRLRFRLTTELRLDRERSGSVTDLPR